ncbi:SRPBCC family protein [Methyloraptor flagellatus]|jgi:uncharacterized protein YndB with AHSA1/START domain|uniref:SRPBCC family protein n=1 Tax=Methyloraptor flagellatus TaxID=3162530 RepID=A0AAU7XBM3_9HYPH
MTIAIRPAPVIRNFTVKATPARAFDVFTAGIGRWWPRSHKTTVDELVDVVVEPGVGGRWYGKGADGTEETWGKVLAWEPPGRLVLAWQIDARFQYDPSLVTEVEIRFTAQADGTTAVAFEHRDLERFGEAAEQVRGMIGGDGGWPMILDLYAEAAAA